MFERDTITASRDAISVVKVKSFEREGDNIRGSDNEASKKMENDLELN